jgi:putative FmdB family regulatory protein
MPIYEYACEKCGTPIEVMAKVDDPPPKKCEHCGAKGKMSRQVSRTSFVLKGGGWYSDLYGSTKKGGSSSAETKSESKSESKSETSSTKSETKTSGGGDKGGGSGGSSPASGSGGSSGGSSPAKGGKGAKSQGAAA